MELIILGDHIDLLDPHPIRWHQILEIGAEVILARQLEPKGSAAAEGLSLERHLHGMILSKTEMLSMKTNSSVSSSTS